MDYCHVAFFRINLVEIVHDPVGGIVVRDYEVKGRGCVFVYPIYDFLYDIYFIVSNKKYFQTIHGNPLFLERYLPTQTSTRMLLITSGLNLSFKSFLPWAIIGSR